MLIRSEWDLSPVYLTGSISYRYRDGRLSCAHWILKFRLFWLFEIGFNQPLVAAVYWLAGVAQTASDRCDWATNNMSLIDISGSVNWLTIRQSNNIRLHMVKQITCLKKFQNETNLRIIIGSIIQYTPAYWLPWLPPDLFSVENSHVISIPSLSRRSRHNKIAFGYYVCNYCKRNWIRSSMIS